MAELNLVDARQRLEQELEANPDLRRKLMASTEAEVGDQGSDAKQAYIESVMNRALARGKSLDATISDAGYYPKSTLSRLDRSFSGQHADQLNGIIDTAIKGSNVANFATGNESGAEHSGGAPVQFNPGSGERFVLEKADSGWTGGKIPLGPPSTAIYKGSNPVPEGAVHKRVATPEELSAATPITPAAAQVSKEPAEAAQAAAQAQQPESPLPFNAVPSNPVKNISQLRQEALEQGQDPDEAVAGTHSEEVATNPDDNRVALRTNPDTGSQRTVGSYFVPGDAYHSELLSEMDPEHQAKLPAISQAIGRGGPFSFMYGSAPQEGGASEWEGEAPTGESRGYEQSISSAQHRMGGGETQQQQVMMLPQQLVAEGQPGNRSISLEGYGSQQAINNAKNIIGGANAAKIPVPYASHTDPKFQKDLMGFLENQGNGYRGDGSGPVLDESGAPHKSYKPETGYVPHLLQKPEAEFVHAALNIRPGKKKMTPGPAPSLRERAQWIRRINEAYTGHVAGQNTLLDRLDRALPQVGVRNKKGDITRHVPWSHNRGTLESTWRKYRPELMSQLGTPPIGSHSMRELAGAHLVHQPPVFRQHAAEFQEHPPAPISGNPEVGAPAGTPDVPPKPGLLAGDESETEAAPPQPPQPQEPELPTGTEFASPSIRSSMTYNAAKLALNKEPHQRSLDFSNRVEDRLAQEHGHRPAENRSGIGHWADGAENTIISHYNDQDYKERKLALALKGLHGGQKQVLSFRRDENGPHSYYQLTFNNDKPEEVADLLDKHGIQFRTFEPYQKKVPVVAHIVDTERSKAFGREMEKLVKSGQVIHGHHWSGHAEFLGDKNGESREDAANEYRRIIGDAAKDWDRTSRDTEGGQERSGVAGASSQPPWQDLHDEAEENFRKLRAEDEFQEGELKNDYSQSKRDRDDVPRDQKRELNRLGQISVPWTARNPELDPQSMHAYLLGRRNLPSNKMTKRDIGEYVDANHEKLDLANPGHHERVSDMMFRDIMHSLAGSYRGKPNDAYGWYDRSVRKTIDKVSEIAPEIKTDPASNLAFRIALATTSQGQKVPNNADSTYHAYKYWQKHGELPTNNANVAAGGKEIKQIMNNLRKMNDLWAHHEKEFQEGRSPLRGHEKLNEILTTPITKGELLKQHGLDVSGERVGHVVRGAMGLGPKIGAFFSNLSGHFDPVTMDRWFARNMNFYTGNMFNFSEDAVKKGSKDYAPQLDELREMLKTPAAMTAASPQQIKDMGKEISSLEKVPAGKLTRATALEKAPNIYGWAKAAEKNYMRSYQGPEKVGPRARSYHDDFATPENLLAKRIHENVNELADAPRNSAERDQWRAVVKRVDEKLKEQGINLTNADKQAVPWFDIKDLFRLAGSNALRNVDYLDAAYTLVRKVKQGLMPDLTEKVPE